MKKILIIGDILAEIMADSIGDGFLQPQPLTGPFPSGASAIYADQAARLGQPVAIISSVGDDDFGRLNLNRLAEDGVDISGVFVDPDRPTGSAFVRYREDGSRDFVYNIRHSACGYLHVNPAVRALIHSADHLHVTGPSLASPEFAALNLEAAETLRRRGGTISFDPNLRKEILPTEGLGDALSRMLVMTDLYLPSDDELTLLTDADETVGAVAELLQRGVRAVVHKRGAEGAAYFDAGRQFAQRAFPADEIDPTGAGDCFGAAFTSLWLRRMEPARALRLAAACGALAVAKRGPMEGASDLPTLEALVRSQAA
ncbi:MAG: sugar kinase [Rhodobacteraceae bacterium]|nr:sugar kinase [Paracoccaceae bacterium]